MTSDFMSNRNQPEVVREAFNQHYGQMCISSVTLMELIYSAEKSLHTGQVRAELAKMGTPIGPYDTMIAGHARSLGFIIITNNVREFERVPGLRVEDWVNRDNSMRG